MNDLFSLVNGDQFMRFLKVNNPEPKSADEFNIEVDHWSGPNGCHEQCPACAKDVFDHNHGETCDNFDNCIVCQEDARDAAIDERVDSLKERDLE